MESKRNCSFVKQTFLESKTQLIELKNQMELVGFFSLGCLASFLVITLISFLIASCFKRINPQEYSEQEMKEGGRISKNNIDKINKIELI